MYLDIYFVYLYFIFSNKFSTLHTTYKIELYPEFYHELQIVNKVGLSSTTMFI